MLMNRMEQVSFRMMSYINGLLIMRVIFGLICGALVTLSTLKIIRK